MSVATNTCTKSLTGKLSPSSGDAKDGVACYKNPSGLWQEVVDPNTNPKEKSKWDMSAPFGFTVPDFSNLTGGSSSKKPSPDPSSANAGATGSITPVPSTGPNGLESGGVLIIICVALVLLSVVTFVSTGSVLATIVVIVILIGVILILGKVGILKIYFDDWRLHIDYHQLNGDSVDSKDSSSASSPSPAPSTSAQNASAPKPVIRSEVFHIGGNEYTYQDAPAVCAAYDAELATYDHLNEALSTGAEWCSYGWSQGGMALYPTQQSTWTTLQSDPYSRTSCGRPGINGGYFDPATKFGVNCYGPKPSDNTNASYPLPLPGSDPSYFTQAVNKFKSQLNTMQVNPFNRSAWSGWNLSAHTGK